MFACYVLSKGSEVVDRLKTIMILLMSCRQHDMQDIMKHSMVTVRAVLLQQQVQYSGHAQRATRCAVKQAHWMQQFMRSSSWGEKVSVLAKGVS